MPAKRLLVIDDDADIRTLLAVILGTTEGWEVLTARSGPEGIAMAIAERPDGILLDVMMPGVDGIATLEQLQAGVARDIPVIFFTAKAPEEFGHLRKMGVQGVIAKPFEPACLGNLVRSLLGWD
ncbi:MAG TPA: response regulator [Stenomitos sp.]